MMKHLTIFVTRGHLGIGVVILAYFEAASVVDLLIETSGSTAHEQKTKCSAVKHSTLNQTTASSAETGAVLH